MTDDQRDELIKDLVLQLIRTRVELYLLKLDAGMESEESSLNLIDDVEGLYSKLADPSTSIRGLITTLRNEVRKQFHPDE